MLVRLIAFPLPLPPLYLFVLATKQAVLLDVFVAIPLARVFAQSAFVEHADLLQHTSGGRITPEVRRVNSVQFELFERVGDNCAGSLGTIPLIPVWPPDPVAELGAVVCGLNAQSNRANQKVRALQRDCVVDQDARAEER